MKVLLVGGGGREHAIAWKVSQSPLVKELIMAPGNAGMARYGRCFPGVKAADVMGQADLAQSEKVDFVIVAPDDPLALGLVDELTKRGIPAFGPTAAAARIEASKAYAKALMKKHGIPTAAFEVFTDYDRAAAYLDAQTAPIVVKADGLALGKGAIIANTIDEAKKAARDMLLGGQFGKSGSSVVIEEYMTGREVTQLVFTDGETAVLMPSSQDHKRALNNDMGLNTGGMGAITPSPWYSADIMEQTRRDIIAPTLKMFRAEGIPFSGCLYVELMMTPGGVRVIEYNARFGDPETQAILPLLKSDLMRVFIACQNGSLASEKVEFSADSCACVVLASGGYPEKYETGFPISGIDAAQAMGALVFHAGTAMANGQIVTAGGRVLGVSAVADTLDNAVAAAYASAGRISFNGMHMRTDIGKR